MSIHGRNWVGRGEEQGGTGQGRDETCKLKTHNLGTMDRVIGARGKYAGRALETDIVNVG
jgi:hypothetical protein